MDPNTRVVVPGLAGGLVVASLLGRLNRRFGSRVSGLPTRDQVSTDMINMTHVQVVGIGGLGLVTMCAIVAASIPTVGLSLAAGFVLGTLLSAALILRRRKSRPIPSSSQQPGADTMLTIDARAR